MVIVACDMVKLSSAIDELLLSVVTCHLLLPWTGVSFVVHLWF